ncbi:hypothetical protein BDW22DRAFT_1431151 [Trametopsis cervina]|nr:hypothetical protein BDW22DRAFT_1431151 [Trametopsis cervina]
MSRYLLFAAVMSFFAQLQVAFASPIPVEPERRTDATLILSRNAVPRYELPSLAAGFGAGAPEVNAIERLGFNRGCNTYRTSGFQSEV